MLRCNLKRHKNGGEVPLFAMSTLWLKDGMLSSGTKFSKLLTEPVKIDLSSTEEISEKLSRKLSWFTMSRRAGNSCLLQSSWPFPCTRILLVVIAGLPRARSARGTEPHTHGIWSSSFLLVVT